LYKNLYFLLFADQSNRSRQAYLAGVNANSRDSGRQNMQYQFVTLTDTSTPLLQQHALANAYEVSRSGSQQRLTPTQGGGTQNLYRNHIEYGGQQPTAAHWDAMPTRVLERNPDTGSYYVPQSELSGCFSRCVKTGRQ
jgi:hypothetical protein